VHQGNGTASIFRDDASVFTLSLHGQKNFPFRKEPATSTSTCPTAAATTPTCRRWSIALDELERRFDPGW
jgi:hypothetical protein